MTAAQRKATEPNATPPRDLFPSHTTIPRGCMAYPVPDGAHFPYLTTGDFAIIDKGQREIVPGGLFLIQQTRRQTLWQINEPKCRVDADEPCWMLNPMNKVSLQEAQAEAEAGGCRMVSLPDGRQVPLLNVYMSDGPIFERVLKKSIIGRVVGVYRPKAAAVGI